MTSAYCPDCDESVNLKNARVGQKLFCPHCETEVEVIGIGPLELDWAYDSSYFEDWADQDQDD